MTKKWIDVSLSQTKTLNKFSDALKKCYAIEIGRKYYYVLGFDYDEEIDVVTWKLELASWGVPNP
jgi:hypothetical protein